MKRSPPGCAANASIFSRAASRESLSPINRACAFALAAANAITAALPSSSVADCRALMIAKFSCENQTSRNGRSFRSLMPCATSPSLPTTVPARRFFGYCASSGTPLLINWSKRSGEGTAPGWSRSLKNASKAASATGSEAGAAALADAAAGAWAKSAGQTETSDERIRTRNNEWVIIGDGEK